MHGVNILSSPHLELGTRLFDEHCSVGNGGGVVHWRLLPVIVSIMFRYSEIAIRALFHRELSIRTFSNCSALLQASHNIISNFTLRPLMSSTTRCTRLWQSSMWDTDLRMWVSVTV